MWEATVDTYWLAKISEHFFYRDEVKHVFSRSDGTYIFCFQIFSYKQQIAQGIGLVIFVPLHEERFLYLPDASCRSIPGLR